MKTLTLNNGLRIVFEKNPHARTCSFGAWTASGSAVASRNGRNILLFGNVSPEDEIIRRIRAVTLEDLRTFSKNILDTEKISLCAAGKITSKNKYQIVEDC